MCEKKITNFLIFLFITISFPNFSLSENNENKINDLFNIIKKESTSLLNKSLETFSSITNQLSEIIESEIKFLEEKKENTTKVDIQDKIDSIRLYVDEISELKKKQTESKKFTIISKSKKDYRIKIDDVLKEIEPILFDGEIVNYASKIRQVRQNIKNLEDNKVKLNEKFVTASDEGTLLKSSKKDIKKEIKKIDELIKKSFILIDNLEFDLKRKMHYLGIKLTREQIRVMTSRVDGDELTRSFAIFDVTKQISSTLGLMMEENNFNASATVKYYGTYVILSEVLGFTQREYIEKIEKKYIPALKEIEDDVINSIKFAKGKIKESKTQQGKNILTSNIKSNKFTLEVLSQYKKILINQISAIEKALENTNEQISIAYSTYDTAANSANLVSLINQTQDAFNKIMNMQLPNIIPFDNIELETKFEEISNQLITSLD